MFRHSLFSFGKVVMFIRKEDGRTINCLMCGIIGEESLFFKSKCGVFSQRAYSLLCKDCCNSLYKKYYNINHDEYPNVNHVHDFSWYVGNYPTLQIEKIDTLIETLNNI